MIDWQETSKRSVERAKGLSVSLTSACRSSNSADYVNRPSCATRFVRRPLCSSHHLPSPPARQYSPTLRPSSPQSSPYILPVQYHQQKWTSLLTTFVSFFSSWRKNATRHYTHLCTCFPSHRSSLPVPRALVVVLVAVVQEVPVLKCSANPL